MMHFNCCIHLLYVNVIKCKCPSIIMNTFDLKHLIILINYYGSVNELYIYLFLFRAMIIGQANQWRMTKTSNSLGYMF